MKRCGFLVIAIGLTLLFPSQVRPCTNFLVTKGASADGSTMVTYAADSHVLYGELYYTPAAKHAEGEMLDIYEWDTGRYLGKIPQVAETFSVVGNMNEHQVVIGETTYTGRKELKNDEAVMDYGSLMYVTLQRAGTAREAIEIMGGLMAEYGYYSTGEVLSVADPDEVWFMGIIGKGPEEKGAVWVALRIPDGYVSAHANHVRIGKFPFKDKKNCLYSEDVVSFARKKGYFEGEDEDFSFAEAYAPMTWRDARIREARVWSFFRAVAPSRTRDIDWLNAKNLEDVALPLWVKPDRKLSARDLMFHMQDHFEGTQLDMTKGLGSGAYVLPYRWRPLVWEMDKVSYLNERATATQQTGFSFITQSRSWLPGPIGGLVWFGVDDAASSVWVPMYCGIKEVPHAYAVGTATFHEFSWDSAFWVFNFVANWAYGRYKDMIEDIRVVQNELQGSFFADQAGIERAALALYKQAPELARTYLTEYSRKQAARTVERWRRLGIELFMKYLDGNVRDEKGNVTHPGYPKEWYRRIINERGDHFRKRRFDGEPEEKPEH